MRMKHLFLLGLTVVHMVLFLIEGCGGDTFFNGAFYRDFNTAYSSYTFSALLFQQDGKILSLSESLLMRLWL